MPRLVLIGASGRLGCELRATLQPLGDLRLLGRPQLDLERADEAIGLLRALAPDVIVNAAGYTGVDAAESDVERAHRVNGLAPGVLADIAATLGAWFVHYSTDCVFDGRGESPYVESDAPRPLSAYGRSKLEGERRVAASGARHLVFRTGWLYAAHGPSFPRSILDQARTNDRLRVVNDEIGAPTGADLVARATAHAIRVAWVRPEVGGLYHVAAAGETSRHGLAVHLVARARQCGWSLRVAPDGIEAVPGRSLERPAARPLNARLDTQRFRRTFEMELPDWHEGIDRLVDVWSKSGETQT